MYFIAVFSNCRQNFENNNDSEKEAHCKQTLLSEIDSELNLSKIYDWNLKGNEAEEFSQKCWREANSIKEKYFVKNRQDDKELLNSPNEIRKRRKRGERIFVLIFSFDDTNNSAKNK